MLNRLLTETAKKGASVLHLTVGSLPMMRLDNKLITLDKESIVTTETLNKIINTFLSPEEMTGLKEKKEIILVKTFAGNFRFRVNIFYQKNLPSVSFRYIPETIKSPDELKIPKAVSEILKLNSGLLVIAGPYGAGKTTTAMSLLGEINRNQNKHIIMLEEPIEYSLVSQKSVIEQRQIGSDARSFADALAYCLEEDIDVVYVGEMRKEFAAAMPTILELASGNSLVILEIDASSSIRAIEKILNAVEAKIPTEAARYSLADILVGIIAQKLLPRRGGGMILAAEVLLANSAVKSLVREGKIYQLESVMQTSRKEGMVNMEKALEELVRSGEVRQEDI